MGISAVEGDTALARAGGDRGDAVQPEGEDVFIVHGLRSGDAAAAHLLVARYSDFVHRVLTRLLGSDPELADLVQDVFVQVLTTIGDLREPAALRAWLARITVFVARGRIRRRVRRRWLRFLDPNAVPEVTVGPVHESIAEVLRAVYRILDRMPTDERIPLALRRIEGCNVEEIAEACAVSVATAKRRLARGEARFLAISKLDPVLCEWLASDAGRWRA